MTVRAKTRPRENKVPGLIYWYIQAYKERVLGWPTYWVYIRTIGGKEVLLGKIYYVGAGAWGVVTERREGMWRAWRSGKEFNCMRDAGSECLKQYLEEKGGKEDGEH